MLENISSKEIVISLPIFVNGVLIIIGNLAVLLGNILKSEYLWGAVVGFGTTILGMRYQMKETRKSQTRQTVERFLVENSVEIARLRKIKDLDEIEPNDFSEVKEFLNRLFPIMILQGGAVFSDFKKQLTVFESQQRYSATDMIECTPGLKAACESVLGLLITVGDQDV